MIRLTLLLLAAITLTMILAGEPEPVVTSSEPDPPVEVSRGGTDPAALPDNRLALDDETGAIDRALAATAAAEAPRPTVQPAALDPAAAAAAESDGGWYVTGSRVNLREGPSTATAVVGQVREGQRAEVLGGAADGWMHIRIIDSGLTAYIYGRFLAETPAG